MSMRPQEPSARELCVMAERLRGQLQQNPAGTNRSHPCREIESFVEAVNNTDPELFTEDEFVELGDELAATIDELERYASNNVDAHETSMRKSFERAVETLREARSWIIQGCSPDPARRPTDEELEKLAVDSARKALSELDA